VIGSDTTPSRSLLSIGNTGITNEDKVSLQIIRPFPKARQRKTEAESMETVAPEKSENWKSKC
jgi:hypothetical protein